MFDPRDLAASVVVAPMAGGPSTPALVAAVGGAGGLGFLAGGYLPPERLGTDIAQVRAACPGAFGVNLFVPEAPPTPGEVEQVRSYRAALKPLASRFGVELPEPMYDDDAWAAKVAALVEDPVPVVSFTFGLPDAGIVAALRGVGSAVWITVTNPREAVAACGVGADALVVQGPEAGGHRGTHAVRETPGELPLADLVAAVRAATGDVPVLAAGGIGDAAAAEHVMRAGALAVVAGTAFLLTDEAGTAPGHRRALRDGRFTRTATTRAFSGRVARGLENRMMREHPDAPAVYPLVNRVTGPLRRAAGEQGDLEVTHLWAGAGWRDARPGPAADVVAMLTARA